MMRRYCARHEAMTLHVFKEPNGSECIPCMQRRGRMIITLMLAFFAIGGIAAIALCAFRAVVR